MDERRIHSLGLYVNGILGSMKKLYLIVVVLCFLACAPHAHAASCTNTTYNNGHRIDVEHDVESSLEGMGT